MTSEMNTAGRLRRFLFPNHKDPNTHNVFVWAKVFQITLSTQNINALTLEDCIAIRQSQFSLFGEVTRLEEEVRQFCEGTKFKPEVLLAHVPQIKKALADTPLGAPWSEVRSQFLNDATLTMLSNLETLLPSESVAEQKDLEECKKLVDELFEFVRKSEMPIDLRRWILTLLSSIRRAIDDYQIGGAKSFHAALANVIGEFVTTANDLTVIQKPENSRFLIAFNKLMSVVKNLAALYSQIRPIAIDIAAIAHEAGSSNLLGTAVDKLN